jgi:hypothetical protein
MSDAETAWANQQEWAEERRRGYDHDEDGCEERCHPQHVEDGIFEDGCEHCLAKKSVQIAKDRGGNKYEKRNKGGLDFNGCGERRL